MKNTIHKTHRDNMYATVSLYCLQDPRVSGLAKALHFYAISRPEGWVLRMEELYRRAVTRLSVLAYTQNQHTGC